MKTELKKLDSTKREISIEVSGDIVKNKFEDVFSQISKSAKIPGFRPGHAPRDILEKKYSSHAHELVMKKLIPELYAQAIDKEGLEVLELPNISDVKLDRMTLSFKAQVEVSPEIPVKNYKGIKVTYKKIEVSPEAIKRNIDSLKEARKIDPVRNTESIGEENKVSNGVDVMPNVVTQVDSHRHPEETPQKDTTFGTDNNFARSLGYPNLTELEKAMERQIYIQEENLQRQKIEKEIVEGISNGLDFKLPQSLVNRQLQDLVKQAKLDLALKGSALEKIEEQQNLLTQQLEPEAKAQVKIYLVLAAIAKRENISIDDHMPRRVMEFLLKEANWIESN